MKVLILSLVADELGTTAVEYGLIAALVSLAGVASLQIAGASLQGIFTTVSSILDAASP